MVLWPLAMGFNCIKLQEDYSSPCTVKYQHELATKGQVRILRSGESCFKLPSIQLLFKFPSNKLNQTALIVKLHVA